MWKYSIFTEKQMNFTNTMKITSFTDIIAKVRNHKNGKLVKNKPESLWPL